MSQLRQLQRQFPAPGSSMEGSSMPSWACSRFEFGSSKEVGATTQIAQELTAFRVGGRGGLEKENGLQRFQRIS